MAVKLKPLAEQVVVITGASSGIGLATARMAAKRGARLVLAARSEGALNELVAEIAAAGGRAVAVAADVGDAAQVHRIHEAAHAAFGGFDTWVNDAAVGLYGRLEETPIEDMRRLFDTNVFGLVQGSLEAVRHFKEGGRGGALINVGSEVSERAVPLQGAYSASKHAVKGFTDALRMELEDEGAPVSVTLVKPGQIDTPFTTNAKNYLDEVPKHVAPVYAPEAVAEAILHCAETPTRDVYVGGGAKFVASLAKAAPGLTDAFMERTIIPGTPSGEPARPRGENNLDRASEDLSGLAERGNYPGHVMRSSAYTRAALHPGLTALAFTGAGVLLGAFLGGRRPAPPAPKGRRGGPGPKHRRPAPHGVEAHMEVIGADGTHVGTVDKVEGRRIKLTRKDPGAGGVHHYVPLGLVDGVEGDRVRLSMVGALAPQFWEDEAGRTI